MPCLLAFSLCTSCTILIIIIIIVYTQFVFVTKFSKNLPFVYLIVMSVKSISFQCTQSYTNLLMTTIMFCIITFHHQSYCTLSTTCRQLTRNGVSSLIRPTVPVQPGYDPASVKCHCGYCRPSYCCSHVATELRSMTSSRNTRRCNTVVS